METFERIFEMNSRYTNDESENAELEAFKAVLFQDEKYKDWRQNHKWNHVSFVITMFASGVHKKGAPMFKLPERLT